MRSFLLFVLASYAVRCDDNYYVIEMPEEPKLSDSSRPFSVYWNVPTMQCTSKKIPFTNLNRFGIHQNKGDSFRGDQIAILYDPGLFPALLTNETSGKYRFRNGGVPQEGDLEKHEAAFRDILETSVPDKYFNGVGIIDFESWRPVFRQNFGVLVPYKDVSVEIERKLHWWWPKNWQQAEAKRRFEEAARTFMQTTISIAKQMRPRALWGYYGFPYCFNMANKHMVENCADNVDRENNGIYWLWSESTALYPSVYSSNELTTSQLGALIRGRVREAARVRKGRTPILPYFWFRYREGGYLSQADLDMALKTFYKSGADGFIIWGSSKDVNTAEKCAQLREYVETVMGPAIAKYATNGSRHENDVFSEENHNNNVENHNQNSNTNKTKQPDPEYHFVPPENYTQNIEQHVKELIKNTRYNVSENEATPVPERNMLLDIVLHLIMNEKQNITEMLDNTTESISSTVKNNKRDVTTEDYTTTKNAESSTIVDITTTTEQDIGITSTMNSDIGVSTVESTESTTIETTSFTEQTTYETSTIGSTTNVWVAEDSTTTGSTTNDWVAVDSTTIRWITEDVTTNDWITTPYDTETPPSILDVNMTEFILEHHNVSKNEKKGRALKINPERINENNPERSPSGFILLHSEVTKDYTPNANYINNNEKKGLSRSVTDELGTSDTPAVSQVSGCEPTVSFSFLPLPILIVIYGLSHIVERWKW